MENEKVKLKYIIDNITGLNKEAMDEIAGYPLRYKPTNSEFIDMMAYYLAQIEIETTDSDRMPYLDYSMVKSI